MTQGRRRGSTAEGRAGKGKREFRRGKEEGTALLLAGKVLQALPLVASQNSQLRLMF